MTPPTPLNVAPLKRPLPDDLSLTARWPYFLLALALALVAISGGLLALSLNFQRTQTIAAGHRLTGSYAQVIEEQTTRTIQTVDLRLQLAARALADLRAAGTLNEQSARAVLREHGKSVPFVRAMWVMDAQGRILYDADEGNIGISLRDRPYFQIYLTQPDTGFHLGAPVRSRSTGTWLVSASRPLQKADGSFDGIIVAAVEPPYFDRLWRTIELGTDGSIALMSRSGVMMMRTPINDDAMGKSYQDRPLFKTLLPKSATGNYEDASGIDGKVRLFAYRTLSEQPDFVVIVGQSRDFVLAAWRQLATLAVLIWLAASVAVIVLSLLLNRVMQQRARARTRDEQAVRESEARYRELFESNPHPMWVYDLETLAFLAVNDAAIAHYGYSRADFLAMTIRDIRPTEDVPLLLEDVSNAKSSLSKATLWRHRRKDGSVILVEISAHSLFFGDRPARLIHAHDVTARHLAEEKLRLSEENLAITLQSIGDAVIATDADGRITRMNATAERLTGWPLADALGRPLAEVFHIINAQTRLPSIDPAQQVMERGEVVGLANHTTLMARDGREYQIADSAAPIHNGESEIVGVVLVFSDVTEKYKSTTELAASQAHLQATLDAIPDLLFEVDLDGRVLSYHAHRGNLLAAPPEVFLGKCFADFLPPAATQVCLRAMNEAAANGWATGAIYSLPLAQGETWFELSVAAMPEVDGVIPHFTVLARDVTERKQAEAKLQLAASVFGHAREGITITNAQGIIVDVNEAFTRITGYSREEAIGQNPRIFQSDRQDKAFYDSMWRELLEVGHWSGEIWNRRKNGEVFALLQTISAVRDGQGNTVQFVAMFSDISAIKAHQRTLEHIAHFDALTNLPNRLLLADRLHQAMSQAQRRQQHVAVAYLDLDGFKTVNDRHGHDVGDQLLIALATRMKHALREGDTLARIGGDEFVAVLTDLSEPEASEPLVRLLLAAAAQAMPVVDMSVQISASLGVTFFPQTNDVEAEQLIRQADQAMYQAKVAGKNRYCIFDAAQDSSIRGHHESLDQIRLALAQREFVLHYQPKVNMRTGRVIGTEALIRWQHPEKGLLVPAAFLPTIEDHPLAVAVGEWVIDTALSQIEAWRAGGLDIPVSVNIGARQLQQSDFVERLQALLAAYPQVNPASLELEVLETSALADMEQVSQLIDDCSKIGVKFALDDFGTGYSSLTYLKRLRVVLLKIDQSFVRDMLDDPDDLAILQGVIGLAAAFKREVIAEGVETVSHGTALLDLGCELAQGFGIARPMPANLLPAWVTSWRPDAAWSE